MAFRSITDTLRHVDGGVFLSKLSDELAELVRAVDNTERGGKLVIELSVKKMGRSSALVVAGKSKLQKPAAAPLETIFFSTPEGNLLTKDPAQTELPLTVVEVPALDVSQLKQVV